MNRSGLLGALALVALCGCEVPSGKADGGALSSTRWDGGCEVSAVSTLPHVRLVISPAACSLSASAASPSLTVHYEVIVEAAVEGFVPGRPYAYGVDVANLALSEVLSGQGQTYCLCDRGPPYSRCPLPDGGEELARSQCGPVTIPAGTYPRTFTWNGRNWQGASDTGTPYGPPFPPGEYLLTIRTAPGSVPDAGVDLDAVGTLKVVVTN